MLKKLLLFFIALFCNFAYANNILDTNNSKIQYTPWWQDFNDSNLNGYIKEGLEKNLKLEIAKASLEASQAELLTVKLNWLPFVNLFGGAISGSSQNSLAPLGSLGVLSGGGAFFAFLPAYTLNLFTNYTMQKQAEYNLKAQENMYNSVRLAVISQILAAYFTAQSQAKLLNELEQLDKIFEQMITIAKALDKQGITNKITTQELISKHSLIVGQIALCKSNLYIAKNSIAILLNRPVNSIEIESRFDKLNPNIVMPNELPVAVIAQRPDILRAKYKLAASDEGIDIASSALLPAVNLNYFYAHGNGKQNWNNSVQDVNNIKNSNTQNYFGAYGSWVVSPSVFGAIDTSKALFKAELANYNLVVNTALHEIDNALQENSAMQNKLNSDLSALNSLNSAHKTKESMYKRGLIPYYLVLSSSMEVVLLEMDITQTKLNSFISLIKTYQSLGGGYLYE